MDDAEINTPLSFTSQQNLCLRFVTAGAFDGAWCNHIHRVMCAH